MSLSKFGTAMVVATLMGASAAFAASPVTFVPTQMSSEMSAQSLVGTTVTNDANENIGDINYVVIDGSGSVKTLVIGVGGFLGIGEKNVGVPFKSVTISTDADGQRTAKMSVSKAELESAPAYAWTEKSTVERMKDGASSAAQKAKDTVDGLTKDDTPPTTSR